MIKEDDPLVFCVSCWLFLSSVFWEMFYPQCSLPIHLQEYVVMTFFLFLFFNFQEYFLCFPLFFFSFLFRMVSCSSSLDAVSITSGRIFVWRGLPISSPFPLIHVSVVCIYTSEDFPHTPCHYLFVHSCLRGRHCEAVGSTPRRLLVEHLRGCEHLSLWAQLSASVAQFGFPRRRSCESSLLLGGCKPSWGSHAGRVWEVREVCGKQT